MICVVVLLMGKLVELKNGETYNGHLVNCDTWMNIHLREVICTSKVFDFSFFKFLVHYLCGWLRFVLCFWGFVVWVLFQRAVFICVCFRMEIGFGGCQNAIFAGILSNIFEFQMRSVRTPLPMNHFLCLEFLIMFDQWWDYIFRSWKRC